MALCDQQQFLCKHDCYDSSIAYCRAYGHVLYILVKRKYSIPIYTYIHREKEGSDRKTFILIIVYIHPISAITHSSKS